VATQTNPETPEVVGLIPAGGKATRLAPLPCSKEMFPLGFRSAEEGQSLRPKVVSHYLLEKMKFAGISKAYFVLAPGKWDIPAYYGDGSLLNMHLAYLMLGAPFGVPFTLDQAYPFVRRDIVAFGFPDILFESGDVFSKLLAQQAASHADVTLGLFPANHSFSKEDRVDFNDDGEVREIFLRPSQSRLRYSWAIAVWNPSFTQFLHDYVADNKLTAERNSELSAGHAIQEALRRGLSVVGMILSEKPYLDIGSPEGLREAIKNYGPEKFSSALRSNFS
jgi:glucose-1-phosphate thymidylyltransferase